MKKIVLLILVMVFTNTIIAQTKIRPGMRLGFNSATITESNLDERIGLNAAFYANFRFAPFYALQPELVYSQQGGNSTLSNQPDLKISYLSVALANKFFFSPKMGLYVLLGPSLDFDIENNFINIVNGDNDTEVTPIDISLFGGIGYEFDFGLGIEARYKHGLIDVDLFNDYDYYNGNDENSSFNSVFQIGISYTFQY